jgi:hypothetical protein
LNDAITYGRAEVWARYLHDNAVFTDEEGAVSDKAAMVAQIQPLPAGISGNLSTQDFRAHRFDDIIVCTYIIDERETYHSAQLHCQYRNTVTWVSTHDGWKLISGQSLALRTDPPEFALTPAQQQDYVGVYRLSGDTTFTITRGDGGLSGQQNGARARVLKAEVLDLLFSPGRPRYRYVFMRDAHGRVDRMIQRRDSRGAAQDGVEAAVHVTLIAKARIRSDRGQAVLALAQHLHSALHAPAPRRFGDAFAAPGPIRTRTPRRMHARPVEVVDPIRLLGRRRRIRA